MLLLLLLFLPPQEPLLREQLCASRNEGNETGGPAGADLDGLWNRGPVGVDRGWR